MNATTNMQGSIERIKIQSQRLKDEICEIKEEDASAIYYVNNLKRLSLQSLDLFNAMQKQMDLLNNQKKIIAIKQRARYTKREKRHEQSI